MPLDVEVKRWIQTHIAHTNSYIYPVQKDGAFLYISSLPTESGLDTVAAALTPCSVVVLSSDPIHPFSWTLLNQKTIKETQYFLG